MSISSIGNETAIQPQTESDRAQLNEDLDNFLLMLTTQLQNQDPLSPMDTTEFTNQLIGFSTVEQLINQNEKTDQLIEAQSDAALNAMIGYVGLEVQSPGSSFEYESGTTTLGYEVPNGALSTSIAVLDDFSRVVWRADGNSLSGKHDFTWDGRTLANSQAEPGTYRISVSSLNSEGDPLTVQTYTSGIVTALETTDTGVQLSVGNRLISATDVVSVRQPEAPVSADIL